LANRKKPGVAFWATVMVVVELVAYPLSFGPCMWLMNHGCIPSWVGDVPLYAPLGWLQERSAAFARVLQWYVDLWGGV
jgi:hypothetical protein